MLKHNLSHKIGLVFAKIAYLQLLNIPKKALLNENTNQICKKRNHCFAQTHASETSAAKPLGAVMLQDRQGCHSQGLVSKCCIYSARSRGRALG